MNNGAVVRHGLRARRSTAGWLGLICGIGLLAGCTSSATAAPAGVTAPAISPSKPCGSAAAAPVTYAHVIWIWDENYSIDKIIGSADAPYINALARECGMATNYTGLTHPSGPNYIAATSGALHAAQDDCTPTMCPDPDVSLFEQVKTWKSYAEGEAANCDAGYDGDNYDVNHNPPAYYTRIRAACLQQAVPAGTVTSGPLAEDLAHNTLPQFSFIAPNLIHDMHNGTIQQGDTYLSQLIPAIVASPAYQAGSTAIIFTFDEGETTDTLTFVAVSPSITPGTVTAEAFNPYSLLRTTEEMLGIPTFLQNAGSAASMRNAFHM